MEEHIRWQAEREEEMESLYRTAAARFATHPDFARFLLTLAEQERDHGRQLTELPRPELNGTAGIDDRCDLRTRADLEELIAASRKTLATEDLSEEAMLEVIVKLEFSEWNSLYLLTADRSGQSEGEFRRLLAAIETHRKTIEDYLRQTTSADHLHEIIHNLAPLWKRRILIVDDEPVIARLLGIAVAPYGEIEVTTSPAAALQHLRDRQFDAMISDVCMPEMDGIKLYQEAIKLHPEIGDRFLFFTATSHQDHLRFIADHNIPILKKPATLKVLKERLTALFS